MTFGRCGFCRQLVQFQFLHLTLDLPTCPASASTPQSLTWPWEVLAAWRENMSRILVFLFHNDFLNQKYEGSISLTIKKIFDSRYTRHVQTNIFSYDIFHDSAICKVCNFVPR